MLKEKWKEVKSGIEAIVYMIFIIIGCVTIFAFVLKYGDWLFGVLF